MLKKPWGGRFKKDTHKIAEKFSASVDFDRRLYKEDIEGSIAHVTMLAENGIILKNEAEKITKGLKQIEKEIDSGKFTFREEYEDIHLNIEKRLIEKIGDTGGKIHTARSRNDQIALDMRLYLRKEINEIILLLKDIAECLIELAEKNIDTVMPLYTHLQRGQPVLLSHHLMGLYEMLKRDRERYIDCLERVNVMPLGAGAGAGTTFPIDREYVAKLLGFPKVTQNSIDTVSDRDFIVEFIAVSANLMMHLSRVSEEFVLWSTKEFDFIDLGDEFTTGSSIMPQKRNPDMAELIRGKTGRVYGNLVAILTIMKGLPFSYNRDMQEDKEPMFDTGDTVKSSLDVLRAMLKNIAFKHENMKRALAEGFITATDIADYLTRKGMPFRNSHEVTGRIVGYAEEKGRELTNLHISEYKMFSKLFEGDLFDHITLEGSISGRKSYGGTARQNVVKMIAQGKKETGKW
ncbi:MAG: argininosuccinate lyase [Candidatus Dadabacteria bacterium RIFCSPHIGHO2_12_FULL_53_21]|nr:MAG: argininosuccinate lyase [Candidatus Dadabacteria bacterium RIFCSPHIGHO2_12_FULL_53_21]